MPDRTSFDIPGHAHELTFSCYRGYQFLSRTMVCRWLAEAVDAARLECGFHLWAYVFMPEHVHMVVMPRKDSYSISRILRAVKEPVGRRAMDHLARHSPEWLARLTRRRGKRTERLFWQSGGGYDRNIVEPNTLLKMMDYIHANPVRRGLVSSTIEWEWSSARWYAGLAEGPILLDPPEW